jgi:hypothetical protein
MGSEVCGNEEVQPELSPVQHDDCDWAASRQCVCASILEHPKQVWFGPARWQEAWWFRVH